MQKASETRYQALDFVTANKTIDGVTKGGVYQIMGADVVDGNEVYAVKGADGDVFYTMNHFDKEDLVNHPSHYTHGKYEAIDVIEDAITGLPAQDAFLTGQVLKYMLRWFFKNGLEDLKKARWYLERLISKKEGE